MDPETADSSTLIAAARKGSQSASRELIRRHQAQVASTIYGILGVCDEAEDIGQETFLRFFGTLNQFREEASPATYLTRIAVNLCINEIRKRQRHRLFHWDSENEGLDKIADRDFQAAHSMEQIAVHNALQRLKPKYRTILVLRHMCGYTTAETASILSLPLGTVLSRLSRAQDRIRSILDPSGKENHYASREKAKILV